MSDVKWIKLATALPDNRKLKMIRSMPEGNSIALLWIYLLCLAGDTNDGGCVYFTRDIPYTDEMIAAQLGFDVPVVRLALKTFEQFGMIDIVNDIIHVTAWERWQDSDKLELMKEKHRIRSANYRARKALETGDVTVTSRVTQSDAVDKNREDKKRVDKNKHSNIPTEQEVVEYCKEKGLKVNPQDFFEYFNEGDWIDSKGQPVLNWKQKLLTWDRKGLGQGKPQKRGTGSNAPYEQHPLSDEQLNGLLTKY